MTFQPSKYQQDIFDWIDSQIARTRRKPANLVVQANPGSGKTTTLCQAAQRLPVGKRDKAIFVAFNKHIANELQDRLPQGMTAKTLHGVGYSAIVKHIKTQRGDFRPPRDWVDGGLNRKMAQDWLLENQDKLQLDGEDWKACADSIAKLVDVCQLTLTDWRDQDAIWEIIQHYGLDELQLVDLALTALPDIFKRIIDEMHKHISFGSMIWLPVHLDMRLWQYELVMADESQDFNACQRRLVRKLCRPSGFTVWVADPRQAIYGFAFASTRSVQEIIDETKAETLPLSICYRCPTSHIEMAGEIYPEARLEARHGAPEGTIADIYDFQIIDTIRPGDLVISRVNAPLIPLCFRLIREGIGARIKGRDIGANLKALIKKMDKSTPGGSVNWEDPYDDCQAFKMAEHFKIQRASKDAESAAMACENLTDKVDTILAIWEGNNPQSTADMERQIDKLFADEGATVWLSTIHKAKGLEADNVYIVMPSKLPHPMAKKAWEREQEENMRFIAYSRAKDSLYFAWNQDESGCPAIPMPEDMEPEAGELLEFSLDAA